MNRNPSSSGISVWITGIDLDYGKLYDGNNMDNEVSKGSIIGTEIKAGKSYIVYSCGRSGSPSGTEGTVTVSDAQSDGNRLVDVYWDCPYSGKNKLSKQLIDQDWFVDMTSVQLDGAIGTVEVRMANFGG